MNELTGRADGHPILVWADEARHPDRSRNNPHACLAGLLGSARTEPHAPAGVAARSWAPELCGETVPVSEPAMAQPCRDPDGV